MENYRHSTRDIYRKPHSEHKCSTSRETIPVLWKHKCVPNPKSLVANHGSRNYFTHSQYSCHQQPGVTGPLCSPYHTNLLLKGSFQLTTPGTCNYGTTSSLFHVGLFGWFSCLSLGESLKVVHDFAFSL